MAILRQEYDLQSEADFGSTPEQLDAALVRILESPPVAGGQNEARRALGRLQEAWEFAKTTPRPCRIMVNETKSELGARVGELRQSFAITMDNLHATARFLAGLPGLKMLVMISDSLELRPGAELLLFAQNVCPNERELNEVSLLGDSIDLRRELLDFTSSANANRITFYPMQASGLQVSSVFGVENRAYELQALRGVDFTQRSVQQGGLRALAKETGGTVILNRNGFRKALASVARDMDSYYSLAYVPPNAGDGQSHRIDVRVNVPKARVRHRLSYRDKSPAQVRDERLEGAIAFGLMDNPLGLRLAAGTVQPADADQYSLPLHLLVPRDSLTFFPGPEGDRANVEVVVRASEARSGQLVTLEKSFDPVRPAGDAATLNLQLAVTLPEGVYVLGVAVSDSGTGATSVVSTTLAIHDPLRNRADSSAD
ncbi:MAG: VWA domain-containing protein [Acidobacteriota bacterium]